MGRFKAVIEVWLKKGLVDAEGQTVKEALNDLGYKVTSARVGKIYHIVLEAQSKLEAEKIVDEICRRLLANPVKDNYSFKVEEEQ
mgnify:CR=1 FL=1